MINRLWHWLIGDYFKLVKGHRGFAARPYYFVYHPWRNFHFREFELRHLAQHRVDRLNEALLLGLDTARL
jgi:hypothetical protein